MTALRANSVALSEVTPMGVGGEPAELVVAKTYAEKTGLFSAVAATWLFLITSKTCTW